MIPLSIISALLKWHSIGFDPFVKAVTIALNVQQFNLVWDWIFETVASYWGQTVTVRSTANLPAASNLPIFQLSLTLPSSDLLALWILNKSLSILFLTMNSAQAITSCTLCVPWCLLEICCYNYTMSLCALCKQTGPPWKFSSTLGVSVLTAAVQPKTTIQNNNNKIIISSSSNNSTTNNNRVVLLIICNNNNNKPSSHLHL